MCDRGAKKEKNPRNDAYFFNIALLKNKQPKSLKITILNILKTAIYIVYDRLS